MVRAWVTVRRLACFVAVILVVTGVGGVAAAGNVAVVLEEDTFAPGEETELELEITNQGNITDGMGGTIVEVDADDAPITVQTSKRAVGNVPAGSARTAAFDVVVAENATPGSYDLEVDLEYHDGGADDELTTETVEVAVEIDDRAQFRVVDATADAHVGEPGAVELTLENVGEKPARDASVSVRSPDRGLQIGDRGVTTRTFTGEWKPGERQTVRVAAEASGTTEARTYELRATVDFEDTDGVERTSRTLTAGVDVGPTQAFTVGNVTSDLRVGEDGRVTATVQNEGPRTVDDVIAIVESPNPNVAVRDPERYVGTVEPGKNQEVSFRVGLREDTEPGERSLPFVVRYRTPTDEIGYTDRLDLAVDVEPELEPFAIEAVEPELAQGSSIRYEVQVRNTGDGTYSDVEAKLFADSPLEVTDDEAYLEELEPDETATVTFGLEAEDDATPGTYPVSIDFRYEDEDGDRHLSDRERLPVEVVEDEFPRGVFVVGSVLGLLLAAGGVAYWKRDQVDDLVDSDLFGTDDE